MPLTLIIRTIWSTIIRTNFKLRTGSKYIKYITLGKTILLELHKHSNIHRMIIPATTITKLTFVVAMENFNNRIFDV